MRGRDNERMGGEMEVTGEGGVRERKRGGCQDRESQRGGNARWKDRWKDRDKVKETEKKEMQRN